MDANRHTLMYVQRGRNEGENLPLWQMGALGYTLMYVHEYMNHVRKYINDQICIII
jgi:hypothetical protein